ncbi:YlbF family regulator [Paenibacillus massiliensis]|uniref:YlbF family regulator n=1 Tax=Paenibacillus massiliensis TaxID=225917 RepID=UPI0003773362|nr:YlbF family regulator [Paenibacillus massiliensis]
MSIYDKAHDLAKALKESGEVEEITAAMKLVDADPEAKRMLDEFRQRQMDVQQRMMSGDMPQQEEIESMEKLFEVLSSNLNVRRLFDAERRLSVIIEDVNKIITESLQHLYGTSQ